MKFIGKIACILIFIMTATVAAQDQPEMADKTLSPYFQVLGDDPNVDHLPLKSTAARVGIAGVIADVRVTQTYENEGKQTLEAIYVFPGSTRASVYGMKMTIGERTIIAKVREREQARQEYEQAKQDGKSASLLEQQRPNVFQMNVANILPGDVIKVELSYTELLVPTDGVYEFVYPTVVGPRYSNLPEPAAPKSEHWVKSPYLHEGEPPPNTFDMVVSISGSMPIQEAVCPSHQADIRFESPSLVSVKLDPSEKFGGNKDFILKYRLAGGNIESGLLLYEGERENFFLLMVQPPKRVTETHIPPREYVFIVDVSGSMNGFPLDISKQLLKDLIGNLRPTDKFNVLLFAGGSRFLSEASLPATPGNIRQVIQFIERQHGGGGTELLPALNRALGMRGTEGYSRSFVIVTDGYVHVEKQAFDLIRNSLGHANMFTFGIGSSVNRYLLEGMARVGMGEPFIITKKDQASGKATKFRKYIQSPVLTRAHVDFDKFEVYDVEPPGIPDLLAERPVIVFGKWRGKPRGKIRLSGITGNQKYQQTLDVSQFRPLEVHAALPYLWARHKIALLSDYGKVQPRDEGIKEKVTQLGLTYNLLTAHTSFVAIDTMVRAKDGKVTTVKQPLPLPEGVSDYAVGGQSMRLKSLGAMPMGMMPPPAPPRRGYHKDSGGDGLRDMQAIPSPVMEEPKEIPPPIYQEAEESKEVSIAKEEAEIPERLTRVRVVPEKIVTHGSLPEQDVEELIWQHLKEIEHCYENALQKIPGLKGEAVLKIAIDASGQVTEVRLISRDFTNEDLNACIIKRVRQWQFPGSTDGKAASVEYSLVFKL